jgi:hypothetical protein
VSRGATRSLVSFRVTLAAAASLLAIAAGAQATSRPERTWRISFLSLRRKAGELQTPRGAFGKANGTGTRWPRIRIMRLRT